MSKNFVSYQDALSIFSEYAEEINKSIKKFSVMPNYMNFELGTIIQYVGNDSGDYVNGYFYERTASGWVQKNTQPTASGLGTAAFLDVPTSGDAAANEVVKGNDSRLSDSRPASDVSSWAKQSTKPTYNKSEVGLANVDNTSDATKKTNFTGSIASGNTGFATGGDVYTALGNKVDKVTGKGLSTNDYTDADKEKVDKIDGIEESIEAIKDYTGYKDVLGLEVDYENKSFKRLASAVGLEAGTDFNAFRMYSGMRRCNLDADGNVTAYRGEDGYSESQNTMVEIPYFYYRMEPLKLKKETKGYSVKKARYYISEDPHPGFKLFPAFEIDGRILDAIYYSAFNGSLYDTSESAYLLEDEQVMDATVDKLVSIIGAKPASGSTQNLTKANLEAMAQNLGSGYHVSDIYAEMALTWLMLIEYGVHDFQRTKLGYGVVNKSSGSGNESVKNGLATNLDETGSTFVKDTTGLVSICYRWIENPYGNIWNNIQAVNVWGDGTMQGGECFICADGNYNESKHDDNYEGVGFYLPAGNSYVSAFGYGKEKFDWLLLPSEATGADNALPVGDYVWLTANLNGYRIAVLGAAWNDGLPAGRSSWHCSLGVGYRYRSIGGRLVYRKLRR